MAKRPEAGATKTRLAPRLTPGEAAELYECMLADVLDLVRSVPRVTPLVAVAPPDAAGYFRRLAPDVGQVAQEGGSLGERLANVLTRVLGDGFDAAVAVGSDVPTLPAAHLTLAFDRLADDGVDVVLGPSDDGGYHLIGWKRPYPALVTGVRMSTPRVLADTLAAADAAGVRVELLPGWYDVDRPEDLDRMAAGEVPRHTRAFLAAR